MFSRMSFGAKPIPVDKPPVTTKSHAKLMTRMERKDCGTGGYPNYLTELSHTPFERVGKFSS